MMEVNEIYRDYFGSQEGSNELHVWSEEPYQLYQEVCDKVFGRGVVDVKPAKPSNETIAFGFVDK